jgi:hypothetical protein
MPSGEKMKHTHTSPLALFQEVLGSVFFNSTTWCPRLSPTHTTYQLDPTAASSAVFAHQQPATQLLPPLLMSTASVEQVLRQSHAAAAAAAAEPDPREKR